MSPAAFLPPPPVDPTVESPSVAEVGKADVPPPGLRSGPEDGKSAAQRLNGVGWLHHRRTPLVLLGVVSVGSLLSRALWLGRPDAPVFDENYYVGAARSILRLGVDPNAEHPPLAKAAIAASMRIFGDNPLGWRFASLVFGTVAILVMYWLVRAAKGSPWLALGAATLLAADNLFLVHGRIATLDIFVLAFMLGGVALYLADHPLLGGVVIAVGSCAKLVGIYALAVVLIFEVLRTTLTPGGLAGGRRRQAERRLAGLATCTVTVIIVYLGLLYLLDRAFTGFTNPFDHIRYMYGYGSNDKLLPVPPGVNFARPSSAWQWLVNREPIGYYRRVSGPGYGPVHTTIYFQGRMNPFIIYMAVPAVLLAAREAWARRDQVSFLIISWCLGTFIPFVILSLQNHYSYIFYMLVVLPGVCLAVARLFSGRYLPWVATAGYGLMVAYGFWSLYPIRSL